MPETTTTRRSTGKLEAGTAENPRIRVTAGAAGRANPANNTESDRRRPTPSRTPPATDGPVELDKVPAIFHNLDEPTGDITDCCDLPPPAATSAEATA